MDNASLLQSALQVIEQYAAAHQQLLTAITPDQDEKTRAALSLMDDASRQRELLLTQSLQIQQHSADSLEQAQSHISLLMCVCAEAYQMAGALDASVPALDNLSAAANGETVLPHETFLPHPCNEELEKLRIRVPALENALSFYANGEHYTLLGPDWQRNIPGDAPNWFYNTGVEDGDELVEDGSIAKQALLQASCDESPAVPPAEND